MASRHTFTHEDPIDGRAVAFEAWVDAGQWVYRWRADRENATWSSHRLLMYRTDAAATSLPDLERMVWFTYLADVPKRGLTAGSAPDYARRSRRRDETKYDA